MRIKKQERLAKRKVATRPDRFRYLKSLGEELQVQSRRVRDLIGDSHWLSDGHHKEYLLTTVLNRHLPTGVIASRGFVIRESPPFECSTEQDILIVDTNFEAPLFSQGGLVIVFPKTVLASISVKSTFTKTTMLDAVLGLNALCNICKADAAAEYFLGAAYFFEISNKIKSDPSTMYGDIKHAIQRAPRASDILRRQGPLTCAALFSAKNDYLFRCQRNESSQPDNVSIAGFHCEGLSTGIFLVQILEHVASTRGRPTSSFADFATFALTPLSPPTVQLEL